jgi:ketosteroid isomerase-like protein
MSDLDRVREMYDAWNNGNVDRMIEFWWDDATWEDLPDAPDRQIVRGRENVEARLRDLIAMMGEMEMEVVELEELGDEILGSVQVRVVGSASGISLDAPGYHLIRFEGGRVRRYRTFRTREQALEAAESA